MTDIRIELHSDTQTRPTPGMRQAMADAVVGDEQKGEDPSVNRLLEMAKELFGKEDAVFMPSGTMCNQISLMVHCKPGDEVLADRTAHILNLEGGGAAVFAGSLIRPIEGERGVFTGEQLRQNIRAVRRHTPKPRLVSVEQTSNQGGGTVWPLETIRDVAAVARDHDMAMHMDGARVLNAVVASNVSASDFAEPFDTMWLDLSKGLGCPFGAVLLGSTPLIEEAWQWKQRMGGAMRQSGVIAAAGIYALENHVDRMVEDHDNARFFAERIAEIPGVDIDLNTVETNLVFFDLAETGMTAAQVHDRLLERGVRIGASSGTSMRAVTHLDVSRDQLAEAADILSSVVVEAAAA
ncbi:MAG: low specificity L-threonine aldolase [Alphaproteobacteria bacterium]|nr:low specificity L-threonine aldolase [Alphaproteobacteria bacterium]